MTSERYESAVAQPSDSGGVIVAVDPGSFAHRCGLRVGDTVAAVDGQPVRDVIDWQWLTADDRFVLDVYDGTGASRSVSVVRRAGEPAGVEFSAVLFDGVRECDNACTFCFVAQLPRGLRGSLSVRDDDFRLSFLSGTFVTLTNLSDADVVRIIGQRLSPLYVSVQAVNAELRGALLRPRGEDRALARMDQLLAAGIELHAQVVLVPGVNDGAALDETLSFLAHRPGVLSVGIVPVGLTSAQRRIASSFTEPLAARTVVEQLNGWQQRQRAQRGCGWVYAADELFLAATGDVPADGYYDDYPQIENGIGLVRTFLDDWDAGPPADAVGEAPVAVTGTLFAPVLRRLAVRGAGDRPLFAVLAVQNRFFGGNVSVAGLLAGRDMVEAIREHGAQGTYLVPDIAFNDDGLTLDGMCVVELAQSTGATVRVVSCDAAGLLAALAVGQA